MSSSDETEGIRRAMQAEINSDLSPRAELEKQHGQCWDTEELRRDFDVVGFMAPFVVVSRKSDGVKGTMLFRHAPRIYFGFQENKKH